MLRIGRVTECIGVLALVVVLWFRMPLAQGGFTWTDLGTLGGPDGSINYHSGSAASAINDNGQVTGYARAGDSRIHAYIWTPGGTGGIAGNPQMEDLGIPANVQEIDNASAINNAGQVAGYFSRDFNGYAFLWTRGATDGMPGNLQMKDLGTLGGSAPPGFGGSVSVARGINDAGQVVGFSRTGPTHEGTHAFLWTPGGTDGVASNPQMLDLRTLGHEGGLASNTLGSDAFDINNHEQVVGSSLTPDYHKHAFLWTRGGTDGIATNPQMKDLGTLGGGWSEATSISDTGAVVGWSNLSEGGGAAVTHAFLWTPGATDGVPTNPQMKDLGALGGRSSFATGVSGDTVVGFYDIVIGYGEYWDYVYDQTTGQYNWQPVQYPITQLRAFQYKPSTGMVDIGDPLNDPASAATASSVNIHGQIAASAWAQAGGNVDSTHGFSVAPGGFNTQAGSTVSVTPTVMNGTAGSVTLTFDSVATSGTTTVMASSSGAPPPAGFKLTNPPIYYDITTTATFSSSVRVCLTWQDGQIVNESRVRLFHYEGVHWVDITDQSSIDTVNNRVCGLASSLSPFTLFQSTYPFTGFFQPVDNAPTVNKTKAGNAIPIKFSLGGERGLNIFAAAYPRVSLMQCDAGAVATEIEQTVSAGGSSLTYDISAGQYTYVWKTDKAWAGSCRQFQLGLDDGEIYTAKFNLTK
jgi:probable HAF family extracellular repeat protein